MKSVYDLLLLFLWAPSQILNEYILKPLTRDRITVDGQRMWEADLFQRIMIRNTHSAKFDSIHKQRGKQGINRGLYIFLCVQLTYTHPRSFRENKHFKSTNIRTTDMSKASRSAILYDESPILSANPFYQTADKSKLDRLYKMEFNLYRIQ